MFRKNGGKSIQTKNLIGGGFSRRRISKSNYQKFTSFCLMFLLLFETIAGVFLFAPTQNVEANGSDTWYNTAWNYRKQITIDYNKVSHVTESSQTNFPVLISLIDPALKTTGHGGKVQNDPDGYDIVFASSTGSQLDHEIEKYDPATGEVEAWVKIPTLSGATDTVFYIYYGNSNITTTQEHVNNVWNNGGTDNFKGVWHMNQSGIGLAGDYKDSTQYANNSTNTSDQPTITTSGQIGNAESFDGTSQYVDMGNDSSLDITNAVTVSAWVNPSSITGLNAIVAKSDAAIGDGFWMTRYEDELLIEAKYGSVWDGTGSAASVFLINTPVLVTFSYDGSDTKLYKNGLQINHENHAGSIASNSYSLRLGKDQTQGYFSGSLDEVRISNTARSADWIATEYNNQSQPTEFSSLGIEEVSSPSALSSFAYRKAITIDQTKVSGTTNLTNFPVLINLPTDDSLRLHAQNPSGNDILFTSSTVAWNTGTINDKLAHEIEAYTASNGSLQAWVKIPQLSSTVDTIIYMYYGNATATTQQNKTAVWDNNTKMVQHMNQTGSNAVGDYKDSTQYANDSVNTSDQPTVTTSGQIGNAESFDGTLEYVDAGSGNSLQFDGNTTVDLWVKINAFNGGHILGKDTPWSSNKGYNLLITTEGYVYNGIGYNDAYSVLSNAYVNGVYYSNLAQVPTDNNAWNHIVFVFQASNSASGLKMGCRPDVSNFFNGSIDEVRISNTARSADWIATEYSNQSSQSFITISSQEDYLMHHFSIIGNSATLTAGVTQSITLTASDISGNTDSLYTGDRTITLTGVGSFGIHNATFTDKNGNLVNFGSSGIVNFAGGVAHTNITLYKAESVEIDISDGIYSSSANPSYDLNVTVSPNQINSFEISAPSNIISETPFSLTLTAKDAFGNITTDVSSGTALSVNYGKIDIASISSTEFQGDGAYTNNIIISEIYSDRNIVLTIRNGSITQTINLAVVGVSHGIGFTPTKPIIAPTDPAAGTVPSNITLIAISRTPDFANVSWQPFDKDKFKNIDQTSETLYVKFRTDQGAVSNVIIYTPQVANQSSTVTLNDGDIVKTINNPDVYIIKYKNGKQYKRLILSPLVFKSYGHLKWDNIKIVSQEQLDNYTTSNLVKETIDTIIYILFPSGDKGEKSPIDTNKSYDADSIYEINKIERDIYKITG